MSTIWFTSDLHLSHLKVAQIRFPDLAGGDKAELLDAHDAWITSMWGVVGKRDQVFILGDIAVSKEARSLQKLILMPGRKHLIAGNHDPVFAQHSEHRAALRRWADSGVFETIQQHGTIKVAKEKLLLSHFPYLRIGDGLKRDGVRYQQWRLPDYGTKLLHGHTHSTDKSEGPRMLNVGVDAWRRLVNIDDIAQWVKEENNGLSEG